MSPLSPERYVAVLAPGAVGLWRRAGAGRLAAAAERGEVGRLPAPDAASALEALATRVEAAGARRGELAVVVSAHFARLRLIPWSDEISSPAELESYVRIGFEEVYGAAAAGWMLRVSPEPAGHPRIAVALEPALVDGVQALAQRAGLRLASLQPYPVAAFNRLRKRLPRRDFLFVAAEPGRSSMLVARGGCWQAVRSTAAEASDESIAALIERECALDGLDDAVPPPYVHVAGRGQQAWPPVCGAQPVALAVGAAPADAWTEMALAEA